MGIPDFFPRDTDGISFANLFLAVSQEKSKPHSLCGRIVIGFLERVSVGTCQSRLPSLSFPLACGGNPVLICIQSGYLSMTVGVGSGEIYHSHSDGNPGLYTKAGVVLFATWGRWLSVEDCPRSEMFIAVRFPQPNRSFPNNGWNDDVRGMTDSRQGMKLFLKPCNIIIVFLA